MSLNDYKTFAEILQALITILGILAAGVWTLYNFGITRFSAPQVNIDLNLKSVNNVKDKHIAIIEITVKNNGRTKVAKRSAVLEVRPLIIHATLPPLARINTPLNYSGEVHEVLTTHSFLEPNEQYHEEIGFIVSGYDYFQVGLAFVGVKRFQTWEASCIFDVSEKPQASKEVS